jgi:hypothetical protein
MFVSLAKTKIWNVKYCKSVPLKYIALNTNLKKIMFMVSNTITTGTGASDQDLCAINCRQNIAFVPFIALSFNWPTKHARVSVPGVTSGHKALAVHHNPSDAKINRHHV